MLETLLQFDSKLSPRSEGPSRRVGLIFSVDAALVRCARVAESSRGMASRMHVSAMTRAKLTRRVPRLHCCVHDFVSTLPAIATTVQAHVQIMLAFFSRCLYSLRAMVSSVNASSCLYSSSG